MNNIILGMLVGALYCMLLTSCDSFLDAKPYSTLAQPRSIKDLRAMLDREDNINNVYPMLAQVPADELEINYQGFATIPQVFQDAYKWDDQGTDIGSWRNPYLAISIANVVLESLERIDGGSVKERRELEGEALFIRGWMFFNLAQVYCAPYSVEKNNDGLGLVLRLDSDSEVNIGRSSLEDTYRQIMNDMTKALLLLPDRSEYITRPSKLVVYAALARLYLTIGHYTKAEEMVDEVLEIRNDLLDYNTLNLMANYPLELEKNKEIIYYATGFSSGHFTANANTYVNPDLIDLYEDNDLRKEVYFEHHILGKRFRGFYHGQMNDYFAGLALDEMYLIKAECAARRQDIQTGLTYLNELRKHRFDNNDSYILSLLDGESLLEAVLLERRKQLVCRGIRWIDLRRLNLYERHAVTLVRKLTHNNEQIIYELKPNDLKYVALIPMTAIEIGKYVQNPR